MIQCCNQIVLSAHVYFCIVGVHEAIYHGVPMLCVPLFGDQPSNAFHIKVGVLIFITGWTRLIQNVNYEAKSSPLTQC